MTLALALLRALSPFKGAGGAIAALQIAKIWLQVVGVWHALYLSVRLHGVGVCPKRKPFMKAIILRSVRHNSARQLNVRSAKAHLRTTVGGKHQDFSISWNGQHDRKHAAAPLPASRPSRSSLFEEDVGIIFEDGFQASGESSPEASPAGLFRDDREEAPGDVELETSRTPKARAQKVPESQWSSSRRPRRTPSWAGTRTVTMGPRAQTAGRRAGGRGTGGAGSR